MPTLEFKGKQYIYSHHLSVPFRELLVDSKKSLPASGKKPNLDDNLIIHGDNLHALKALMPQYAGKIKCIYIDPPYNTGNEGWCYNDNVNSPLMKDWLSKNANPVDKEDMQRHDKWLCMMYPRLKLLHELLADDGVIFISIDDNEQHRLRMMMDEIFGKENFVEQVTWHRKRGKDNSAKFFSKQHEYALVYAKNIVHASIDRLEMSEETKKSYKNPDNDPCGKYRILGLWSRQQGGTEFEYKLKSGKHFSKRLWLVNKDRMQQMENDNILVAKNDNLYYKKYLTEHSTRVVETIWLDASNNANAKDEIKTIFQVKSPDFETPKPTPYLKKIIKIGMRNDGIILDSFAGSGTTAHAVLALNKEDGGNRKFIMIEMEDYANDITAERVRRVIKGVPKAKDDNLKNGLGGSFTFCELGNEISIEKIITGESLPDYGALAKYVFYTATGKSLDMKIKEKPDFFVGETDLYQVYLIYKPDISFLRSNDSALNDLKLKAISARKSKKEKLVFATAKYRGQKELAEQHITFCQLPYAIHKVVGA